MDILSSKAGGICRIEFNRPDKKNAITAAMYQLMADALKDTENDGTVRAIVIAGKPDIFTAGNDLEDFMKNPPLNDDAPVIRFMMALSHATKPIIAAVAGAAVGIGTTMLAHCDLVYAADNAKFSLPFTPLGLCPEFGSSLLLPQMLGHQRAAEKFMLGEAFSAQEAHDIGLVSKVVALDRFDDFVRAQAAKLVALPAASLRITKRLMRGNQAAEVDAKIREELTHFVAMLGAQEAKEAFAAFFEKRAPDFTKFA